MKELTDIKTYGERRFFTKTVKYYQVIRLIMWLLGVAIHWIFGSDADCYKNPFKKKTDFPRISDSWNLTDCGFSDSDCGFSDSDCWF